MDEPSSNPCQLPPLPKAPLNNFNLYTADMMRAYAAAAVAMERERWQAAQTQTKGIGYGINPRTDDAAAIRGA